MLEFRIQFLQFFFFVISISCEEIVPLDNTPHVNDTSASSHPVNFSLLNNRYIKESEHVSRYIGVDKKCVFVFSIQTISGSFNEKDELTGTLQNTMVTESVPSSFYCTGGCGGSQLSLGDQHYWENGECIKHETCT